MPVIQVIKEIQINMKFLRDIIEAAKKEEKKKPEPQWYVHNREGNIHSKFGRQDDARRNSDKLNSEFWNTSKKIQQYECSHVDQYLRKMFRRGIKECLNEGVDDTSAIWIASGIYEHPKHGKRVISKKLMAGLGGSMTPLAALEHIKKSEDHKKLNKSGFKLKHIETRPDTSVEVKK